MTQEFEILYQLVFLGTAVSLVLLERVRALQRQRVQIARRWTSNIGLFIIGSVVDTLVLPVGIYAFALHQAPGFVSRLGLSFAVELLLTFLVLDLWRYWEHRFFHRIPWLWRMHLVHHSDTQIDVTTSERHHPLEFILGTVIMIGLIATLGLPAAAVEAIIAGLPTAFEDAREQVVYEVAMALANVQLVPQGLYDRAVKVLGHESITDMIVLMGYYTCVSLTMNFYAVPAGSPGLAR